jgi:hypothetical protein
MNKLKLSSRAKVFKKFGKNLNVSKQNEQKSLKPIQFNYQSTLTRLEKFNIGKKENKNIGQNLVERDYKQKSNSVIVHFINNYIFV